MITAAAVVLGSLACASGASAAGTVLFNQPFHNNTVNGAAGGVSLPATQTGSNIVCLSASGNAVANPLASCADTAPDGPTAGKLRLTNQLAGKIGGLFTSASVPTSQGLDATFKTYQYGPGTGADGLGFILAAVDPADPRVPTVFGVSGGSLGYTGTTNQLGMSHGYLGVGFDPFGNFSNKVEGSGCTDPPNIAMKMAGQVVVRGPGEGKVGYCALKSTAVAANSPSIALRALTRAASLVPVEVVYNPSALAVTTPSGLTVAAGSYLVSFTPAGASTAKTLTGALPVVPAGIYPASWVTAAGFPKQLAFGWVGATGSVVDYHEIDDAVVSSFDAVPQLAVSQTSYAAALTAGSPVTYSVTASAFGATETQPVTVVETLPAGVIPASASGPGWVCGSRVGQTISCTNSANPFTSGTITVNAVLGTGTVTAAQIQDATSVVASSSDASPGSSATAPAGALPTPPGAVVTLTPALGPAGGNNAVTVAGTNLGGATAVEIGTTAQFAAGTPTTLVVCSGGLPAGCFTIAPGGLSISIPSMPSHAPGAVSVKVVNLGQAGVGPYTYSAGPAIVNPSPPSGEVGVAYSYQFPRAGGSTPFTWSVTAGSLPAGLTLNTGSGLVSGTPTSAVNASFTVTVTDSLTQTDNAATSILIIAGPSLGFPTPPSGLTNLFYSRTLTASGGTTPYAWTVTSGALPDGVTLGTTTGTLSGSPTTVGTASFTVTVTDANAQSAAEATSLTIGLGVTAQSAEPPAGQVKAPYSVALTATGGTTPYAWSVLSGSLPPGITLGVDGLLSGTPTSAGGSPYVSTVQVVDAAGGISTKTVSFVVNAISITAPTPEGTIGVPYSTTATAANGATPIAWARSGAPLLPPGLSLNSGTGVISGTPTVAGTSTFTIRATDVNTQTTTKLLTFVIAPATTVTSSAPSVTLGAPVTLTAHVNPTSATGTVTFRSVPSRGPSSGQTVTLGTGTLSGGTATLAVTLAAFNANAITATYDGDATLAASASAAITVEVSAYSGELIVNQLRLSGPAGAADQYVELYNAGPPVSPGGFRVTASSGVTHVVPASAPVLPTGRSYLATGGTYSLGTVATADSSATHLGTKGVKVEAPDAALTVVDAVGETGALTGYFSGVPLPVVAGTPTDQHAWVRLETAGRPTNTSSNAANFKLVSTTGGMVGGIQSTLGSPSPSASGSAYQQNATLQSRLLDPAVSSATAPNRVSVSGSPGRLTVRRTITNSSSATVTVAKVRLTSLSEANGAPEPGVATQPTNPARLRAVNPLTATSQVTVSGGSTVTVQNLSVDAPAAGAGLGGGLNSTLAVPIPAGLAAGASVNVAFTFAVDGSGTFWFGYDVDALGGSAGFAAAPSGLAAAPKQQATAAPLARAPTNAPPAAGAGAEGSL